MTKDTVVAFRGPEGFSPDPLTDLLRQGARDLIAQRRVLPVTGCAHMGGHTLPDMEDINRAGGEARPQLLLQQLIELCPKVGDALIGRLCFRA